MPAFLQSMEVRDWCIAMTALAVIIQGLAILRMSRRRPVSCRSREDSSKVKTVV